MTKNELAYVIGSQNLWSEVKSLFGKWFFLTLGTLALIGCFFVFGIVKGLKNEALPEWRKVISQNQEKEVKVLSKKYSIKIIKKILTPSPFSLYKIQSNEIKPKEGVSFSYLQVPEGFEESFLQAANSESLKLDYDEGSPEKPQLFYPAISKWTPILDELESDTLSLYITATRLTIEFATGGIFGSPSHEKTTEEDKSVLLYLFACLTMPIALVVVYISQNKRRSIFLKNFKKEDLNLAEPCTIERTKIIFPKRSGDVTTIFGNVYRVVGKDDINVIYNGSKSKSAKGVLLKYEDQYYFFHSKWMPKSTSEKAA